MTKENKELLLKDLCARLPYDVVLEVTEPGDDRTSFRCFLTSYIYQEISNEVGHYSYVPYLRPMSCMTEGERLDIKNIITKETSGFGKFLTEGHGLNNDGLHKFWKEKEFDWLNAHHFDYRGLIEKGLALEAPDGMYLFA